MEFINLYKEIIKFLKKLIYVKFYINLFMRYFYNICLEINKFYLNFKFISNYQNNNL